VFEVGTEDEISSESEVSDSDYLEAEVNIVHVISPYEYVVATVNIEATLAQEFLIHAKYLRSRGTFPLNSEEAITRMCLLIDQLLSEYGIPRNQRGVQRTDALKCPQFVPSSHLVLVGPFQPTPLQVELYPVVVAPHGTAMEDCPDIDHLSRPGYASVYPTAAAPFKSYPVLRTDPPLLPQHTVFQSVLRGTVVSLCRVIGRDETSLDVDSADCFDALAPIVKPQVDALHAADRLWPPLVQKQQCGCTNHPHRNRTNVKSTTLQSHVRVDLDRSAVQFYPPADLHSSRLRLNEEITEF
jgi:hypothetical protein